MSLDFEYDLCKNVNVNVKIQDAIDYYLVVVRLDTKISSILQIRGQIKPPWIILTPYFQYYFQISQE